MRSGSSVSSDESSDDIFEEIDERLGPKIVNKHTEVKVQQEQLLTNSVTFQTQKRDYVYYLLICLQRKLTR